MAELLFRIGRACAHRATTVVVVWLAALVAAAAAFLTFGGTLSSAFSIPNTPTAQVTDELAEKFPEVAGGTGSIVLHTDDDAPFTAQQQEEISALVAQAAGVEGVASVLDPFAVEAERTAQGQQLADGREQLEAGREQIRAGAEQLGSARAELEAAQDELDTARAQAESAGLGELAAQELDARQEQLDAGLGELDVQDAGLTEQSTALEQQATRLDQGAALLDMAAEVRTVSSDASAAIATVSFVDEAMQVPTETSAALMDVFRDAPVTGVQADFSAEIAAEVPSILGVGEVVGLVVAAIVLLVMLGTLVGAGLPLVNALIGVGIGALAAMSLSGVVDMASVTPILGIMLGLAVGIDYSLFIINRHRRQLKSGYSIAESVPLANGTSGNAVVFAGLTVMIALLALNVTGIPFLGLMGTVGAMCIAIAVLVAVTLTPALLSLLGERILSRRERRAVDASSVGDDVGSAAPAGPPARPMRTGRAVARAIVCVVGLLVVAVPALDLRLNLPDGSTEAPDSTQFRAYSTVEAKFGAGQNAPLLVVADLPAGRSEEESLGEELAVARALFEQEDVVAVAPVGTSADGSVAAFQVVPAQGPTSESTENLVHTLRNASPLDGTYEIGVAGSASGNIDISDKLADALPLYLLVVVGLSLVILIVVFRSIFVPVIATAGFILSYFAALGGVVAIYQWGWLASVFGVEAPGPVLNFLPTILLGILFGLAMDYMLFLGSGMREAYAHGTPARLAVVAGMHAGRAVVTAAGIIMISVFGGFIFAHSAMIRPIGFALAFGVLVDAFMVRMVLIPALMHLAGDAAWWLPRWLDRLLPDVDVEGAALERRHPHHAGAPAESA
ncbi:MAG: MMPL family transporter [Cellulomonadaceae bacterium]